VSTEDDPPGPPGGPPDKPTAPTAETAPTAPAADIAPPTIEIAPTVPTLEAAPILEAPPATDDSILPTTFSADDLDAAVGVRPSKKKKRVAQEPVDADGLPDEKRFSRKTIIIAALAVVTGLGIAALVLFGRVNAERYKLDCTTTQAIAKQGRSFPPWGYRALPGAEWRPIALPPSAQCKSQEVEDAGQLEALFLDLLLERTSATLTAKNLLDAPATIVDGKQQPGPLELASLQLEQALLLSRSPERGDQRKQVERLQGDVLYWRASLRLRDATAAMADASRQFDQASLARPMHVSDAGSWAQFLRRLTEELQAGPHGVFAGFPPPPTNVGATGAPAGTARPVEPAPAAGSDAPPPTPDAGVPTGGVLL
jgi:hypothetical protein